MSSATSPTVARPSVFISYASEDRAAARALREMLTQAGLDVWYDENELGGGDAWDQKIRRQIRECDYFMPLISATTERRKEGYFRREWRLAAERTMDMADDVLFLLPVVIDQTSELGARVPDKFVSVQWLRAPGGQTTPALTALVQRLLGGEHVAPPRPPLASRPTTTAPLPPIAGPASTPPPPPPGAGHAAAPAHPAHPPPTMPHFPHAPEKGGVGHWLRFIAEVLWWIVTATWTVLMRLPKWLRFVLAIWVAFTVLGTCRSSSNQKARETINAAKISPPPATPRRGGEEKAAEEVANSIGNAFKEGGIAELAKVGEEIAKRYSKKTPGAKIAGKPLVLVPLARERSEPVATQFAQSVLAACYAKLVVARGDEAAISNVMPALTTDDAWVGVGKQLGVDMVLGFRLAKTEGAPTQLQARLLRSADGTLLWNGDFPVVASEAVPVGEKIAEAVIAQLPKKE